MILRSYQSLPPIKDALQALEEGGSLHLVGPRQEALRALLLGPSLSIAISLGVLLWMLLSWEASDSWMFLVGPLLGVIASVVWLLYSLRLLQSPRVEAGIHCTKERLMTFALGDDAPFHDLCWSDCEAFLVRDDALLIRVAPTPKRDSHLDADFIQDGCAPLNLPSAVTDADALCDWLEEIRRQIVRS